MVNEDNVPGDVEEGSGAGVIELVPSIRYVLEPERTKINNLFGHLGLGFYFFSSSIEFTPTGQTQKQKLETDDNKFGLSVGGGITIGKFEICPLYHIVFTEEDPTYYITVHFGWVFGKG